MPAKICAPSTSTVSDPPLSPWDRAGLLFLATIGQKDMFSTNLFSSLTSSTSAKHRVLDCFISGQSLAIGVAQDRNLNKAWKNGYGVFTSGRVICIFSWLRKNVDTLVSWSLAEEYWFIKPHPVQNDFQIKSQSSIFITGPAAPLPTTVFCFSRIDFLHHICDHRSQSG